MGSAGFWRSCSRCRKCRGRGARELRPLRPVPAAQLPARSCRGSGTALLREPPRGLVHVWGLLRGGGSGVVLGFRFPAGCGMGWGAVLAAGLGDGISAGSPGRRCWVSEGSKGQQLCCYPALEQAAEEVFQLTAIKYPRSEVRTKAPRCACFAGS